MKTDDTMQAQLTVTNPLVGVGETLPPRKSAETLKWGFVTGKRWSDTSWQLRWRSLEGNDVKRMVPAENRKEALALAKLYNVELSTGKAIPSMHREKIGCTLQEAVLQWAANQVHVKAKTLEDYLVVLNAFLAFLHKRYPAVTRWNEIRREHVELYFRLMDKAYDTKRRHLIVIRKVSRDMHLENEKLYPDFCEKARVKLMQPKEQEKAHPSSWQLLHLLEWFRQNYPTLWAQLVLEIGAGLRGFEACFLRVGDVDLEAGTVAIMPTDSYQLKNRSSRRVIPICRVVVNALKHYQANLKVQPVADDAPLFLSHRGKPWTESGICCSRTKAMQAYRAYLTAKGLPSLPHGFKLREMRSVFVSEAIRAGVPEIHLQKYIGHSPNSVLRKHYLNVDGDDLRNMVVLRLDEYLEGKRISKAV